MCTIYYKKDNVKIEIPRDTFFAFKTPMVPIDFIVLKEFSIPNSRNFTYLDNLVDMADVDFNHINVHEPVYLKFKKADVSCLCHIYHICTLLAQSGFITACTERLCHIWRVY